MNGAHTYFLIANWINFLAPTGFWAMWAFLIVDPINNILPAVTDALAFVTTVTTIVATISTDDVNGDGEVTMADAEALVEAIAGFQTDLEAFSSTIDGVIAVFSWPIIASVVLASFNSFVYYWPITLFNTTNQGGKQPRASMWYAHITTFFWQHLIVGAGVPALAFLDSTSFGTGTLDFNTNGLIFIVMASLWGLTTILNIIFFAAEQNWHQAVITYNATALFEDPEYSETGFPEDPNEDPLEAAMEDAAVLMIDQDWSW